jgi:hypothetical protein
MRIMKISADVLIVCRTASNAPAHVSRPIAIPITPAKNAPSAPTSVGVATPR